MNLTATRIRVLQSVSRGARLIRNHPSLGGFTMDAKTYDAKSYSDKTIQPLIDAGLLWEGESQLGPLVLTLEGRDVLKSVTPQP